MPLKIYRQKRNFKKTPEPTGKIKQKSKHLYIIQKHAASHLHYDFRLELNGMLLSWAVPKGPSLDPSINLKTAVEVVPRHLTDDLKSDNFLLFTN